ncbi:MAG: four helix bundle protein [Brevefilum sp.]|nr:four helix bundle protein [Brevefilum sp.]
MANKNQGLETLEIWRRSIDFAVDVCQTIVPLLPPEEKWALGSQLRRSVQSISANIAEGYGRYSYQESIHFCYIARGSMAETKTHMLLAHRLGYVEDQLHQQYQDCLAELGKMLHGYINHLRSQKKKLGIKEDQDLNNNYEV